MTFLDLAVAALAAWQAVEVWHHSALFSGWRAWLETRAGWFPDLMLCPWCLSVWVGCLFVGIQAVPLPAGLDPWQWWRGPYTLFFLSVAACAILLNAAIAFAWATDAATMRAVLREQAERAGRRPEPPWRYWGRAVGVFLIGVVLLLTLVAQGGEGWLWAWHTAVTIPKLFLWGLAASRLANAASDLIRPRSRTPKTTFGIEESDEHDESAAEDVRRPGGRQAEGGVRGDLQEPPRGEGPGG